MRSSPATCNLQLTAIANPSNLQHGIDPGFVRSHQCERLGHTAYQMVERIGLLAGDQETAVSVVTVLELAHGVVRADSLERRANRQRFLDDLLTGMPVQPVTVPIALRAGQLDGQMQALESASRSPIF